MGTTFAFPMPQKSGRFRLNNVPLSKMGWATTGLIQQKKPTPKRSELVNGLRGSNVAFPIPEIGAVDWTFLFWVLW